MIIFQIYNNDDVIITSLTTNPCKLLSVVTQPKEEKSGQNYGYHESL